MEIPGAEHIKRHLDPVDLKSGLALAYSRGIDWSEYFLASGSRGAEGTLGAIKEAGNLASLKSKLTGLDVEPMSPQRMQVLVSGMMTRVDRLITG